MDGYNWSTTPPTIQSAPIPSTGAIAGRSLELWIQSYCCSMLIFPNAKINLGLRITEKRSDGFHNLQSCFYPIGWSDVLEVMPADTFSFSSSGLPIPGATNANLCVRAYDLLKADFDLPPVQLHLLKIVPIGAGLGGGSADGTFTLKLLNDRFGLGLAIPSLEDYARRLGSDCAFFVQNRPMYCV